MLEVDRLVARHGLLTAVQIGTAYLRCPESRVSAVHRKALETVREDQTVITNVITGRPGTWHHQPRDSRSWPDEHARAGVPPCNGGDGAVAFDRGEKRLW